MIPPDQRRRLEAWAAILTAIRSVDSPAIVNDAIAGVAYLMQERTAIRIAHNRELREEAKEAQRGAIEAYQDGRRDSERW